MQTNARKLQGRTPLKKGLKSAHYKDNPLSFTGNAEMLKLQTTRLL